MSDLAFTVIVRLPDGFEPKGDGWRPWRQAVEVLGDSAVARPQSEPPFKRYPREHRHYFAEHVERVLFPPAKAGFAERWIERPMDVRVQVGPGDRAAFALQVDLLEIIRVDLAPYHTYGVMHLTSAARLAADAAVACASALGHRYRGSGADRPYLAIEQPAGVSTLQGRWTLRVLTDALFGAAHDSAGGRGLICSAAKAPDVLTGRALEVWRRALAQGDSLAEARSKLDREPKRDEARRVELRDATGLVFGRAAVFTHSAEADRYLFNVRSYWSEVLLFALVQHSYLEVYAKRLGELGSDPLSREVDGLFVDWLAFRNTLWWGHLSPSTDVPQKLLPRAQAELGTRVLFDELEQSFGTYIDQRQRRSEDRLSSALAALQVYGAVFAAVGTVAAALQVIGDGLFDCWPERIAVLVVLLVIAVAVYRVMSRRVDRP